MTLYRETDLLYLAGGDKQSPEKGHDGKNESSNESIFNVHNISNPRSNSLEIPLINSTPKERIESKVKSFSPQNGGDPSIFVSKGQKKDDLDLAFESMKSVNELYQHKIEWIEQNVPRGSVLSPNLKSKINLYQLWVQDLVEQNQALMEIIRDIETENSKEVGSLKSKISKGKRHFLEQDSVVKALENDIDRLNLVNKQLHDEKEMFKKSSFAWEAQNRLLIERLKISEGEVENLIALLHRLRDECTWNVQGISFSQQVQTQLFGQHPDLPGSRIESTHAIEQASHSSLNEKCMELESAKEELDTLRKSLRFDNETSSKLYDSLEMIQDLKTNLRQANLQLKFYHNTIEDLKGKIRVYCRIRPINLEDGKIVTKYLDPYTVGVETGKGVKEFQFDRIFGPEDDQKSVFDETKSLIQSAFDGYNVCIAAYGQTGSGKTYTILGKSETSDPGIAPMALSELFSITKKMKNTYKTVISFYAVELWRQKLIDLLSTDVESSSWNDQPDTNNTSDKLEIRRDHTGTVFIQGARTIVLDSCKTFENFLRHVLKYRHTAETQVNERSSRSHLIMGIVIENTSKINGNFSRGKLSLIDLAGSERNGKFNGPSSLLDESKAINKSLSALEHVIVALTTDQPHVPYRNNKLTEIMQDSIGGNSKTLIIVNISPTLVNVDETIVSLNYGARIKQVVNGAVRNVELRQNISENSRSKSQNYTHSSSRSKPSDISTPRSKT